MQLVVRPNESLSHEYKAWLSLTENEGKATLARAAIALANHGGGVIVIGMDEIQDRGLVSVVRPGAMRRYTQDEINNAVNRYAEPQLHCELLFVAHPDSGIEHALVIVPGDTPTPVMSRRDCENVIQIGKCYIRKPGPRSEEPRNADEWRTLLTRCMRAARDDLLNAIRNIMSGEAGEAPRTEVAELLSDFAQPALARWQELTADLDPTADARFTHGYYELTFKLLDVPEAPSLAELRRRLDCARRIRHTGWSPFVDDQRPVPVDGLIETWLGQPDPQSWVQGPAHCDFWRADRSGALYQLRGYDEDGSERFRPGEAFDFTLPIWRVGEPVLFVSRLGTTFGNNPTVALRCRYTGLRGRRLASHDIMRYVPSAVCHDDQVILQAQFSCEEADQNLAEVLLLLLSPLYERFGFFELTPALVNGEVKALRRGQF
jgi:hypothetical protein